VTPPPENADFSEKNAENAEESEEIVDPDVR